MLNGDRVITVAAAVATGVVAAIATVISYNHAHELVLAHGESGRTAAALPLTVDGLIATCSLVILACARNDRRAPWHTWVLLTAGGVATLGANVSHGLAHGWIGGLIAGWPALVAFGSFDLLTRLVRDGKSGVQLPQENRTPEVEPVPAELERYGNFPEPSEVVDGTPPAIAAPASDPVPAEVLATARDHFADMLAEGNQPSIRAIRTELHKGHPQAKAIHAALAEGG